MHLLLSENKVQYVQIFIVIYKTNESAYISCLLTLIRGTILNFRYPETY